MKIPTVCIDLGASYTKVGYRPECSPRSGVPFEREADVLVLNGGPLIPSLAVQTKRAKQPWLFGQEAADFRPTAGSQIHTNWKSGLYRPANDGEAAHAAVIAEKYFHWLKGELDPFVSDWELHRLRLTLPAFANGKNLEAVIRKCLNLADWTAGEIVITTEPHANAIGLMTVGRNVVTRGKIGEFVDFGQMFGQGNPYIRTARAATLGNTGRTNLRVAVVDIGAFTTDVALLDFNVTTMETRGDGLASLEQESFAVGTHDDLDKIFWAGLESAHGDFVGDLNFTEREELKLRVFESKEYSVTIKGDRRKFGSSLDQELAATSAKRFADRIWKSIHNRFTSSDPDVVYLTGGGSNIALVHDQLASSIGKIGKQPKVSLAPATGAIGWRNWRKAGVGLDRLATAIGGVSVIAPRPLDEAEIGLKARRIATSPGAAAKQNFRACSCRGNPDCPRCGGTGYIDA